MLCERREGQFYGKQRSSWRANGLLLVETEYPPGLAIPKHSHEHAYFCFVRRGSFSEVSGSTTRTCGALDVVFHPEREEHSDRFYDTGGSCLNIQLDHRWLARGREYGPALQSATHVEGGYLVPLFVKLYSEFSDPDELSPLAVEGLTLEIVAEMCRTALREREGQPPRWLRRVRDSIRDRFFETLPLAGLAEEAGVHPVHLARAFRQHFHCSVGDYIRQVRVEFACRQIEASDARLADIAIAAGFSDQSHLSRTFKRLVGKTPVEFRSLVRGCSSDSNAL